ncbi:MAG: SGNH/GDSL hydrolase family protein, partial [Lachnospiraceae bacterium]|nr:SGNH/GDSL hydrolase family protein [Lachnospiraceae bacterium]
MKKRLTKLMSLGLALAMLFTSVPVSATESVVSTEIVQEESVSSSELLMEVEEESVASELLQEVEAGDAEEIESEEVLEAEEDVVPVELLAPQATENVVPVTPLGDEVTEGNETTNTESEQLPEFLNYKYVLDIDGIDANAEYAIVHKVSGSNRVLHSVATKSDVFNGTVNSNLYTPKVQGTVFTLGSQLWKAIPTDSGEGNYYLQSQLESSQHYYMDLSKESGTLGRVHLTLHNSTAPAPVVKITEGSQDGTYKIQAVSGAEQGQFYLGYSGSHFVTANDGIEVYLYKIEIDDQTNIRFMFNDQPDNRWLFLGGEDSVGAFSHVGSGRSYVGHFEEYIRATQNLDSVNVKQRFMINSASKGRDLSETVDNWESLVPVNKPKAISYMISKEDYNKADAGLEEFSADLTSFIDKALKIGFVVIQYPYKTADDATNSNIEKYIQAAETVIASYADETIKASRITKVNHYEKTGSTANWTEQYLTNGFLNQKGHLEIGKQLALETIGSSSNYPNSFAGSSLVTTIYERPATYSDKLPQVTASNNSLSVTLSQEIVTAYGANYAYELTTTNEAGASVVIKDKVQVTAGTAFVIENLNQGDYWQLQMRTENGQVQLATTEGTVAQGENGADHKPVAFTDRATEAQSELAQKLESEEPMRWLFVGDSITHACKYTYGYDGISQLFDKYVKETLGRPEDVVINTAVWGAFLDDNLGDNAEHRLDYDADVVVIMIGTNDSSVNDRASNYVANMNQLLTKIKAYNPGATIVIRTPLYVWYRTGTPQYQYGNLVTIHNQLKTIAGETAEDGTPKVDFFVDQYSYTALALFEDAWVRNGSVFLGPNDALHPNQLGQLLLFKELVKELGLEDNDSPMTDLMYDIKTTTVDEKATDIRPYLTGDVTKKSITLNVNQLTATETDLRNIEFTVTNPTTEESRTVKADRQITTDLTAKTASIGWPANTKLEIKGLEEGVRYDIQVKGWSISAAKEIVLKTTLALDDEPVPATRTHEEAPQIAGYTLIWPETQTATLDTSKYYLIVAVGENNKAYALYGNQTGVGLSPGNISQADNGKVTAELANLSTTPTATWLKDGSTALDLAEKLEFCLVEGTGENAGKYAFRTMDGYYLNLEDTLFKTSINYLNVQIAADADTTLKDNRYLHFNLKDEQQVNGQENAHHTIYNGFWAPTGKPNTYNIYLYAKDGA